MCYTNTTYHHQLLFRLHTFTSSTNIDALSLHDALPISEHGRQRRRIRVEDDGDIAAVELRCCGDFESDPTAADDGDLLAIAELSADDYGVSGIQERVDVVHISTQHV